DLRQAPLCGKPGALGSAGGAVEKRRLDIAAQERPRIAAEPGIDRGAERAHRGDHRNAEREAAEKDAQAGQTAAQLAPRQAPGERQVHAGALSGTVAPLSATMRPSPSV